MSGNRQLESWKRHFLANDYNGITIGLLQPIDAVINIVPASRCNPIRSKRL